MDSVTLEILKNAFTAVPKELGAALKRTADSPNIKERMDASCVLFGSLSSANELPRECLFQI